MGQALNTASYVVFYEMTKASWRNVTNAVCRVKESNSNIVNGMPSPSPKVKLPCTITSQSNSGGSANSATAKSTPNLYNKPNGTNTNNENKPRIISLGSSIKPAANKLGIVSGAAKSAMAAATTIIRTVTSVASGASSITSANNSKSTSNKCGLVPYDDEDSSDSENTASVAKETEAQILKMNGSSTKRPLTASPFVPRSVTVNALKAKPSIATASKVEPINKETKSLQTSQNILQTPSVERKNSSSGVWTVTDADTYNPSVNSDNSTGSTSGNWTVKDIDSSKSTTNHATEEESMITVQHSKTASSWIVKPALSPSSLVQANAKMSESRSSDKTNASQKKFNKSMSDSESNNYNGGLKSGQRITSPSPSTGSSTSSTSSIQYKQKQCSSSSSFSGDISIKTVGVLGNDTQRKRCNGGNTDDADTDYDAELDRGRTKKVKKTDSGNGMHTLPSCSSSNPNPFQVAQNSHYNKTENRKNDVPNNKMNNGLNCSLQST